MSDRLIGHVSKQNTKKTIPIHGGKALQKMSFSLIQEDLR